MVEAISKDRLRKVAFIYLMPESGEYYVTDDLGYAVQRRPQLGLQYLCSVLERRGMATDIFDQTVHSFDLDWLTDRLREYDLAGFYCSDPQEEKVKCYCKKIKEKLDIPILVGGPSTLENFTFLDYGCDIVVHGEGEITIQDIAEYYDGRKDLEEIKGISYKKDDRIIRRPPQELIKDLDTIPFPDRSKTGIDSYYDYFIFTMRRPYITMIASRGCVYKCAFCTSYKIWEYKYRRRSIDNVLSEMDDVVNRYKVKYVAFQDDIFGVTNDWIEEFCVKLMGRPYRIRWMAILHPFSIKNDTEKILKLMRRAGCDTLSIGLQSAHPQIAKNINRDPLESERLKFILGIANKLNFLSATHYIFGLPGDTRETVETTVEYSLNCGSTLASYYMLSMLRGSELERQYRDKKICELDEGELEELVRYASKRFYRRPKTVFRMVYFIAKNPSWLVRTGLRLSSILARAGYIKSGRRKND